MRKAGRSKGSGLTHTAYRDQGEYSFSKAVHMRSGKCAPVHPHAGKEIASWPRIDRTKLIGGDGTEQSRYSGRCYCQGLEPTFGVKQLCPVLFQILVLAAPLARETR
jgi:hypothetical protein